MSERDPPPAVRAALEPVQRIYPMGYGRVLDAPLEARRRELLDLLSAGLAEATAASAWGHIGEIALFEAAIDMLRKLDDASVAGWDLGESDVPDALRRGIELVRQTPQGAIELDRIALLSGTPRRNGLRAVLEDHLALVHSVGAWGGTGDAANVLERAIEALKRD
jgi:hypothetical protein